MISASTEAAAAIVGGARRLMARALFDLVAPDIEYGTVTASGLGAFSRPEQLYNKAFSGTKYLSMEWNRCPLDGTFKALPDSAAEITGEYGVKCDELSGADGTFATPQWVTLPVTNCDILQATAVAFSGHYEDGYGVDFTVDIYSGESLAHTETVTGNTERAVYFEGFTVYSVTAIKVTVTKWSLPRRYARLVEIVPGLYEEWLGDTIYTVEVSQETDFSATTLPYGTAILTIHNKNMRYDRSNKSGLFKSIRERQRIPIFIGPRLPDGSVEYLPVGVYYQQNGGWKTTRNGLFMEFRLVDIVGLLAKRKYTPPGTLPTTLEGWVASAVSQLGVNFAARYIVDASIAAAELTCTKDKVLNLTCGKLLNYLCMAVGAYAKADASTGYLKVEPPPESGGAIVTVDNMPKRPEQSDNEDIASITFKLNDGLDTQYVVDGTIEAASKTLTIANPFIKTEARADEAAKYILKSFGGNKYEITGRGDMRSELGDMDIVELGLGDSAGGRRYKQEFKLNERGIMKNVKSGLVQATGDTQYKNVLYITETGPISLPETVTEALAVMIGGGNGGTDGQDGIVIPVSSGIVTGSGDPGVGGLPGKIYKTMISFAPGETLNAIIGPGGAPGMPGGATTLAGHSSESGERMDGWFDILSGNVYGVPGADGAEHQFYPINGKPGGANTGNGGGGGSGGRMAITGTVTINGILITYRMFGPYPGGLGAYGGSGTIILYYNE